MSPPAERVGLALDACGLLNLAGAGLAFQEVSTALGVRLVAVEQVVAEALWIEDIVDGELVHVSVDLSQPHYAGLEVAAVRDDQLPLFVALAEEVEDGEAATLAVARTRGLTVLTDDRKARRVASRVGVSVLGTAELLRRVLEARREPDADIGELLRRVERRARFTPRRDDPEREWWSRRVDGP